MESNRCKSIYLAEIQSLCISGGVEFELYIRVKYWPDSNTKLIRSPKVAKLGAFFQHWLNCSSHIQSSHEPDRGLGGSILSRNGLWPEIVFVYLCICIFVFVRQIKVWAGLLVLAKVSNQNCHKSQVAAPVLAGPLTNCGQWKVLKILSVIITKHNWDERFKTPFRVTVHSGNVDKHHWWPGHCICTSVMVAMVMITLVAVALLVVSMVTMVVALVMVVVMVMVTLVVVAMLMVRD